MTHRLSTFWTLFEDDGAVEIPMIQRDFAQGRGDERSGAIRDAFLDRFAEALGGGERVDLDFVYGRWRDDHTLEPLDGQQRLTTLFLLHWYLARRHGQVASFVERLTGPGGSRFSYRTRPSAREFFDLLVAEELDPAELGDTALSDWIADRSWFLRAWRRDPTVAGALVMLDAIHARFATCAGGWAELVDAARPPVVFRLLRLADFGLSDDLYIKMNARGKPLTRLEVFKAELEQFVGDVFGDAPGPDGVRTWRDYVSLRFDTAWTDLLWTHDGAAPLDARFMHLIRAIALVSCVLDGRKNHLDRQVRGLVATTQPSLAQYAQLGVLGEAFVRRLVRLLDVLAASGPVILERDDYLDEAALFGRVVEARGAKVRGGLLLSDLVLFTGWAAFLERAEDPRSEESRRRLHEWTRVLSNLVAYAGIDKESRLVGALQATARMLDAAVGSDLLERVAWDEVGGGFNRQQRFEEELKARLLLRNPAWRPLIERAETHPYFAGGVGFLLVFCGVDELHEDRDTVYRTTDLDDPDPDPRVITAWSDEEDAALRAAFSDWYARACAMFPEASEEEPGLGVVGGPAEYLWERALLAEGSYLLKVGRNHSLLNNADRDGSWRRLLRADTRTHSPGARRDVVRRVLERLDLDDVEGSLRAIVADGVATLGPRSFRGQMVAEPALIGVCHRRMVRFVDFGTTYLLMTTQRNGYHHDFWLFAQACRMWARPAGYAPFVTVECDAVYGEWPGPSLKARGGGYSLKAVVRGEEIELTLRGAEDVELGELEAHEWWPDREAWRADVPLDALDDAVRELAEALR